MSKFNGKFPCLMKQKRTDLIILVTKKDSSAVVTKNKTKKRHRLHEWIGRVFKRYYSAVVVQSKTWKGHYLHWWIGRVFKRYVGQIVFVGENNKRLTLIQKTHGHLYIKENQHEEPRLFTREDASELIKSGIFKKGVT